MYKTLHGSWTRKTCFQVRERCYLKVLEFRDRPARRVSRVGKGNDLVDNILVWIWGRRRAGLEESRDKRRNTDGRKTFQVREDLK